MTTIRDLWAEVTDESGVIGRNMRLMGVAGDIIEAPGAPYIRYTACQPSTGMMSRVEDVAYRRHVSELLSRCPDGDLTLPTEVEVQISILATLMEGSSRTPLTHEATALYGRIFCDLFPRHGAEIWGEGLVNLEAYEQALGGQIDSLREGCETHIRRHERHNFRKEGATRAH